LWIASFARNDEEAENLRGVLFLMMNRNKNGVALDLACRGG
jgi:crotonobetainyl-CoA:carnitine CoA-transferase CaiB-like acyl-CoA transferase